jgi:serine/threonine protein kinase
LAARNILLADDGVAKVADFGMAKKMYYEGNYERTGLVIFNFMDYRMSRFSYIHVFLLLSIGIDASQMDGHRIPDGSHLFDRIGRLVLRRSSMGTFYARKNSIPRLNNDFKAKIPLLTKINLF